MWDSLLSNFFNIVLFPSFFCNKTNQCPTLESGHFNLSFSLYNFSLGFRFGDPLPAPAQMAHGINAVT